MNTLKPNKTYFTPYGRQSYKSLFSNTYTHTYIYLFTQSFIWDNVSCSLGWPQILTCYVAGWLWILDPPAFSSQVLALHTFHYAWIPIKIEQHWHYVCDHLTQQILKSCLLELGPQFWYFTNLKNTENHGLHCSNPYLLWWAVTHHVHGIIVKAQWKY